MTQAHIGVIGVGTMGSALALNFAEKGQDVALWNLELSAVDRLIASAGDLAAVLMIPAGAPVDQTIAALRPLLSAGDTIIDGGNSDFSRYDDPNDNSGKSGAVLFGDWCVWRR